jgi:predicted MFS family arabinose efflux permease
MVPYFLAQVGAQSSVFWIPTFLKRLSGLPTSQVALWVAVPGLMGIAGMLVNGWHSDKSAERRWHTSVPLLLAGAAFLAAARTGNFAVTMTLLIAGSGVMFAYYPVFWSMPTSFLSQSAAAACFGLINSVGHSGGFFGPSVTGYLNEWSGGITTAFLFIGGCYLLAGMVLLAVKIRTADVPAIKELLPEGELPA